MKEEARRARNEQRMKEFYPLNARGDYLLRLASVASTVSCQTGILWGLPAPLRKAILAAIQAQDWNARRKIGWDPTHIEPIDVTVADAKAGKRPTDAARRGGQRSRGRNRTSRARSR